MIWIVLYIIVYVFIYSLIIILYYIIDEYNRIWTCAVHNASYNTHDSMQSRPIRVIDLMTYKDDKIAMWLKWDRLESRVSPFLYISSLLYLLLSPFSATLSYFLSYLKKICSFVYAAMRRRYLKDQYIGLELKRHHDVEFVYKLISLLVLQILRKP